MAEGGKRSPRTSFRSVLPLSTARTCPPARLQQGLPDPKEQQAARASSDVLHARGRVHLQLPSALAQEELDGGKVSLVDLDVLFELAPSIVAASSARAPLTARAGQSGPFKVKRVPRKGPEAMLRRLRLFAALPEALPIQAKHFSLDAR